MANDYTSDNLRRLSDADLAVADNEPDVRGWTVRARDGSEVGEVDDLIVDTTAMKVRYLQVDPDDSVSDSDDELYIPIAMADIDRDQKRVILRGDVGSIRSQLPNGFRDRFATAADRNTRAARDAGEGAETKRMTRAEEEVRVGTRPVQSGEVRVGKHVETERHHEQVTVAKEQVHVERRPVTDANTRAEIRGSDTEIRVPLMEEEVVVDKRPVAKEEVVISKERVQETRPVDVEVRKEEFDIHDDRSGAHPRDTDRNRQGDR